MGHPLTGGDSWGNGGHYFVKRKSARQGLGGTLGASDAPIRVKVRVEDNPMERKRKRCRRGAKSDRNACVSARMPVETNLGEVVSWNLGQVVEMLRYRQETIQQAVEAGEAIYGGKDQ